MKFARFGKRKSIKGTMTVFRMQKETKNSRGICENGTLMTYQCRCWSRWFLELEIWLLPDTCLERFLFSFIGVVFDFCFERNGNERFLQVFSVSEHIVRCWCASTEQGIKLIMCVQKRRCSLFYSGWCRSPTSVPQLTRSPKSMFVRSFEYGFSYKLPTVGTIWQGRPP